MQQKGFPSEFEVSIVIRLHFSESRAKIANIPFNQKTVVKDLWALRLERLSEKIETASDAELDAQIFSSQAIAAEDDEDGPRMRWGKVTDNPTLAETLGLCYLGALLLRLPVGISDLHR